MFLKNRGTKITAHLIDKLTDHLADTLPDSFDEPIDIPLYPLTSTAAKLGARRETHTIAAGSALARVEARIVRHAIEAFFGLHSDQKELWQGDPYAPGVWVTRFAAAQDATTFLRLAPQYTHMLPEVLTLGAAEIDDALQH